MNWVTLSIILLWPGIITGKTPSGKADPQPEWYLPTKDGCKLFVREIGTGPETVIMLHGGFGAEHSYLLDAFRRMPSYYRFVFYDQRGSLRSPCAEDRISVEKHLQDLDLLRTELRAPAVTIVGHSMGTYLAMAYVARFPEHVKRIVLLGAVSPKRATTPEELSLQKQSDTRAAAFMKRPEISAELGKQGLDKPKESLSAKEQTAAWRIHFAGANTYHVERWQSIQGGQVFYNAKAGEAASKSIPSTYDFLETLKSWGGPLTIILGDHDFVDFGAEMWTHWMTLLPNAHLSVIRNAGHDAWLDDPAGFRRQLLQALARKSVVH